MLNNYGLQPAYSANDIKQYMQAFKQNPRYFNSDQIKTLQKYADYYQIPYNKDDFDFSFSILDSMKQLGEGFLSGFTTIEIGKPSNNVYENIFRSIGQAAGFMGFIPATPVSWGAKGIGLAAKKLGLGIATKGLEQFSTRLGAKALTSSIKSVPVFFADRATKYAGKWASAAVAKAAQHGSGKALGTVTNFLLNKSTQHILHGAFRFGVASSTASWTHGIDQMWKSFARGAATGAFSFGIAEAFQVGGIGVGKPIPLSKMVNGMPIWSKISTAQKADVTMRLLANAMWDGLPETLRGATIPEQVYSYVMGAYLGYNDIDSRTWNAQKFLSKYSKEQYKPDFTEPDPIKNPALKDAFEILDKPTQALVNTYIVEEIAPKEKDAMIGSIARIFPKSAYEKVLNTLPEYEARLQDVIKQQEAINISEDIPDAKKTMFENTIEAVNNHNIDYYNSIFRQISNEYGKVGDVGDMPWGAPEKDLIQKMFIEDIIPDQEFDYYNSKHTQALVSLRKKFTDFMPKYGQEPTSDFVIDFMKDVAPWIKKNYNTELFDPETGKANYSVEQKLRQLAQYRKDIPVVSYGINVTDKKLYRVKGDRLLSGDLFMAKFPERGEESVYRIANQRMGIEGPTKPALVEVNHGVVFDKARDRYNLVDSISKIKLKDPERKNLMRQMLKENYYYSGGKKDRPIWQFIQFHPELDKFDIDKLWETADKYTDGHLKTDLEKGTKEFGYTPKEYKKIVVSNIFYELGKNGFTPTEKNVTKLLSDKNFISTASAWNKRVPLWQSSSYSLDKAIFNMKLGRDPNAKIKAIIRKVNVPDGDRGDIRSPATIYPEKDDGRHVVTKKIFDATAETSGVAKEGNLLKASMFGAEGDLGALLEKSSTRVATRTEQIWMDENGVDFILTNTTAKQRGNRKMSALDFDLNKKEWTLTEKGDKFDIDPAHIKVLISKNIDKHLLENKKIAKQPLFNLQPEFFVHMDGSRFSKPEIDDAYKKIDDMYNEISTKSIVGEEEYNKAVDDFILSGGKDQKLFNKISDNFDNISIEKLMEMIKNPQAGRLTRKFLDHVTATNLETDKYDMVENGETDATISEILADNGRFGHAIDRFLSLADDNVSAYLHKWVNGGKLNDALTSYIVNRTVRPKIENSMEAIISDFSDEAMATYAKELVKDDSLFYLGNRFSAKPVKTAVFAKMLKKKGKYVELGELWMNYDNLAKTPELKAKLDDIFDALVFRIPMDSMSGAQRLRFAGFTDLNDYGVLLHPRAMRALGGADSDIDSAHIYFGGDNAFRSEWKSLYASQKYEFGKWEGKKPFNAKTKGGFSPAGRGTPSGDGKDKAMRKVATAFIGEVTSDTDLSKTHKYTARFGNGEVYKIDKRRKYGKSSTETSAIAIGDKEITTSNNRTGQTTIISQTKSDKKVIMLARNGKLKGSELGESTKEAIKYAHDRGFKFVVGDMPGVDEPFIKYLNEINADYTIYHDGAIPRISTRRGVSKSQYSWSRYSKNNYEVSSAGDKRFSALNARLKDGRTIEEAYQLDIKGYRKQGNNWRLGKGKPPLNKLTKEQSYQEYKKLWKQWADENPDIMSDLAKKAEGKVLTDRYASTEISQARALSEILNEKTPAISQTNLKITPQNNIFDKNINNKDRVVIKTETDRILTNDEINIIRKEKGYSYKPNDLIVAAASEHTDPAFHADRVIDQITKNPKGYDVLYLITKHDGIPIRKILDLKIPKIIHFSITGLGGTKYEPGVMKPNDLLDRIESFIKQGLDPNSVTIRFDPIVPGVTTDSMIRNIITRSTAMGITKFRTSILDAYPLSNKNLSKIGYSFSSEHYNTKGRFFHVKKDYAHKILNKYADIIEEINPKATKLQLCGEPFVINRPNNRVKIERAGCVNCNDVQRALGVNDLGVNINDTRGGFQGRASCFCAGNLKTGRSIKQDMLKYNDNCASMCTYCYASKHKTDIHPFKYYDSNGKLILSDFTKTQIDDIAQKVTAEKTPAMSQERVFRLNMEERGDKYKKMLVKTSEKPVADKRNDNSINSHIDPYHRYMASKSAYTNRELLGSAVKSKSVLSTTYSEALRSGQNEFETEFKLWDKKLGDYKDYKIVQRIIRANDPRKPIDTFKRLALEAIRLTSDPTEVGELVSASEMFYKLQNTLFDSEVYLKRGEKWIEIFETPEIMGRYYRHGIAKYYSDVDKALYGKDTQNNRSFSQYQRKLMLDNARGKFGKPNTYLAKLSDVLNNIGWKTSYLDFIDSNAYQGMFDKLYKDYNSTLNNVKGLLNDRVISKDGSRGLQIAPAKFVKDILDNHYNDPDTIWNIIIDPKDGSFLEWIDGNKQILSDIKVETNRDTWIDMTREQRSFEIDKLMQAANDFVTNDINMVAQLYNIDGMIKQFGANTKRIGKLYDFIEENVKISRKKYMEYKDQDISITEILDKRLLNFKLKLKPEESALADQIMLSPFGFGQKIYQTETGIWENAGSRYSNIRSPFDLKSVSNRSMRVALSRMDGLFREMVDMTGVGKETKQSYKAVKELAEAVAETNREVQDTINKRMGDSIAITANGERIIVAGEQYMEEMKLLDAARKLPPSERQDVNDAVIKLESKIKQIPAINVSTLPGVYKAIMNEKDLKYANLSDIKVFTKKLDRIVNHESPELNKWFYYMFPEDVANKLLKYFPGFKTKISPYIDKDGNFNSKGYSLELMHPVHWMAESIHSNSIRSENLSERLITKMNDLVLPYSSAAGADFNSLYSVAIGLYEYEDNKNLPKYQRSGYEDNYSKAIETLNLLGDKKYTVQLTADTSKQLTGKEIVDTIKNEIFPEFGKMSKYLTHGVPGQIDRFIVRRFLKKGNRVIDATNLWFSENNQQNYRRSIDAGYKPYGEPLRHKNGDYVYDHTKFIQESIDLQSDLTKLPNLGVGLDGRNKIMNSMLKTVYYNTPKSKMVEKLSNKETGIIENYFPHVFNGGKTLRKHIQRQINKINRDPNLTDVSKRLKKARLADKYGYSPYDLQVQSDADELLYILDMPDKVKLNAEQVSWMESNMRVGSQESRQFHMPGWDTSHNAWKRHFDSLSRRIYNVDSQMLNHYKIFEFYNKNVGKMEQELLDAHVDFYKLYAQGAMGFGVRIPDRIKNNPRMHIKGTLYERLSDNNVAALATKIGRKLKILKTPEKTGVVNTKFADDLLKDMDKYEFTESDMMWLSNLEAQYQLASLLAHPKSYVTNIYGGEMNNVVSAGFKNLRDSKSIKYLKKINPEWNSMEDVQKYVESLGVIEEFIRHQIGLTPGFMSGKMSGFVDDALRLIKKDPMVADETLISLAKKHELAESVLEKAAWFMRKSERILRRDAFMSHYVQAYKRWGGRLEHNHPYLRQAGLEGVKATQFLYTAPFKPMFSTTAAGKTLTRFQLWAWNNVKLKRDIINDAADYGFKPGTQEFDRFKRMAIMDILSIGLANAFMYSIFDSALPAPWNWMQDFADWIFGDEKERDKAFFGVYPRAVAPLQMITPPALRLIAPTITAMVNNDFSEISNYHIWAAFPFGRIGRDIMGQGNIFQNPYRIIEKTTGIPYRQMASYLIESKDKEPWVGF